jgi:DNA-binding CsgD family transcriptional regulator
MMRTEIDNDFFKRFGWGGSATAVLANGPSNVAAFGVLRNRRKVFQKRELQILQILTPHLIRAVAMNRRLQRLTADRGNLVGALELLEAAVILVDADGCVRLMNPSARQLTQWADGLSVVNRRLVAATADDTVKLTHLVRQALRRSGTEGGDVLLPRPSGRHEYFARICPLPRAEHAESGSAAVVFISDPDAHGRTGLDAVFSAPRLTPTEASVVKALVEGMALSEISEAFEVSLSTVRNHVKRAMMKTDTHRQADLVRLMMASRVPTLDR